jgi:hypothetical protein
VPAFSRSDGNMQCACLFSTLDALDAHKRIARSLVRPCHCVPTMSALAPSHFLAARAPVRASSDRRSPKVRTRPLKTLRFHEKRERA